MSIKTTIQRQVLPKVGCICHSFNIRVGLKSKKIYFDKTKYLYNLRTTAS